MKYTRTILNSLLILILAFFASASAFADDQKDEPKPDPIKEQIAGIIQDARDGGKVLMGGAKDVGEFIKNQGAKSVDVIAKEAPAVYREIIFYNFLKEIATPLMWLIFFLVVAYWWNKLAQYIKKEGDALPDTDSDKVGCYAARCVGWIVWWGFICMTLSSMWDGIFILIAPRIFLIKYVVGLFH